MTAHADSRKGSEMVWKPMVFAICGLAIASNSVANADDVTFEELLQRVQAAEARVNALEAQQRSNLYREASFNRPSEEAESANTANEISDLEALTKKWEEKWSKQTETNDELKSSIERSVQSGSSGTKSMKISGRIHADYWAFPDSTPGINTLESGDASITPQDRFGFRRLRFGVGGDVSPNMGYRIEMEFAGGNKTEFRDAYIAMKDVSFFQTVIVGNHKRPYGLDHLNSSRYNVFMERPFVIESFNQDARRLGISANGVSDDQEWNWRYGVWNQRLVQDEGSYVSDHVQGEIAGRLARTYWYDDSSDGRGYAHFGLSGTLAHPDGSAGSGSASSEARFRHRPEARSSNRWLDTKAIRGANWYEMIGVEKVVNIGSLQMVGEYQTMFMQRDSGFKNLFLHGGYAYVSYFLTGEHIPWERKTGTLGRVKPFENFFLVDRCDGSVGRGWGAWQVAARYSYADFVDQDIVGGVGESVTLGLNWHWNANTRLQMNYIMGEIKNNSGLSGDYDIIGARFMIDF